VRFLLDNIAQPYRLHHRKEITNSRGRLRDNI